MKIFVKNKRGLIGQSCGFTLKLNSKHISNVFHILSASVLKLLTFAAGLAAAAFLCARPLDRGTLGPDIVFMVTAAC